MLPLIKISIESFFNEENPYYLIDVRSPGEFEKGHIPNAINLPLFTNKERSEVGILYKQKGREHAILKGLELAGPKLPQFVMKMHQLVPEKNLIIHCWRGGMRSEAICWLLTLAGFQCKIIEGGYRAYRRYIKQALNHARKYIILGGMTGSGKTEMLKQLAQHGEQVIDLEGLARHKGSAFGGIGQEKQPSTEQFENNLFEVFKEKNPQIPIWLEDESKSIGQVQIPDEMFLKMRTASVIEVVTSFDQRAERLDKEYSHLDPEELKAAILRIRKRLGGENVALCLKAIDEGTFKIAVKTALKYYDQLYTRGLGKRKEESIIKVYNEEKDLRKFALQLIGISRRKEML